MNELRALVKMDDSPIKEIAKEVGLHPNTITLLIRPDGIPLVAKRRMELAKKLADRYNKRVVVKITLEPMETDNAN